VVRACERSSSHSQAAVCHRRGPARNYSTSIWLHARRTWPCVLARCVTAQWSPVDWLGGVLAPGHARNVRYSVHAPLRQPVDVDFHEVAALMATCLGKPELMEPAGVRLVETALNNSFSLCLAFARDAHAAAADTATAPPRRLVGMVRTLSDEHFLAQVLDLCVHPDYQGRGIGEVLLNKICTETRQAGPQSIAVFTRPSMRLFFYRHGFRWDYHYKVLKWKGSVRDVDRLPLVRDIPRVREEAEEAGVGRQ
jgi:ribosomal protein S18 acetylase RimI-like enzyme